MVDRLINKGNFHCSTKRIKGSSLAILLGAFCLICGAAACAGEGASGKKEPEFRRDGSLDFLRSGGEAGGMQTLATISIEVADEPLEQSQGLKFRSKMDEGQGMLFVFPGQSMQSFWMQDTKISLDILFVNENLQIVHIAENTVPFSEEPIRSVKPARYVVEVIAGYCRKHKIRPGDLISTRPD